MRSILLTLIIVFSLTSAACSYTTDFFVVNASESPIEIRYKVKSPPHAPQPLEFVPAIKLSARLEDRKKEDWKDIAADRYQIDQATRTVTVKLLPQEALFVGKVFHYFGPDDADDLKSFPIEEMNVSGVVGEMKFSGKQLLKAFSKQSVMLYTLSYQ